MEPALSPRPMHAAAAPFLKAVAPDREGLVVAVECLFIGSWRADLCAEQAIPLVLGHALYMNAIHGGQAKHDTIDAQQLAALLRGGMLPNASVEPAERRGPRDLVQRRTHRMRTRSARLAQVHNTNSPDNLPESGQNIASKANREGVAERFHDPAVPQTIEVELALIPDDAERLRDLERSLVKTAKQHDAHPLYVLQTGPDMGKSLRRVLLDASHAIGRFPSVQDVAASAHVVPCRTEAAGQRLGPAGKNIGNAHLQWAFANAATLFLPYNPNGQMRLTRLAKHPGPGKALTILAHHLARAV